MDSHAEVLRLRRALRDLVALSSIPAVWVAKEPAAIAAGLADVLIGSLPLDFAFVRLCDPSGGAAAEETRGDAWHAFPEWLQRHLAVVGRLSRKEIIPHLGGADPYRGIVIPIGVNAEGGLVAAACDRPDFPTEIDQLLLSVAANHAATAFQSACLAQALRHARDELEVKVEERTAALREQASLLDLTHDTILVRDLDDVITYWNRGAEELYGWKREEALGKVTHQLLQTVLPAPLDGIIAQVFQTGRWAGELIHTKADGTRVVVASRWSLQRDARGLPAAILEINNDITERKRAEAELRESERRYRNIFQSTGVSIWEEDFLQVRMALDDLKAAGIQDFRQHFIAHPEFVERAISMVKIVDVNDATVELFGAQDKQELLASLDKVFTPETQGVFARELIALAEGRTWFESQASLKTLTGDQLSVLLTITFPDEPAKLKNVLVSIMDITEQKHAEEALRQAHADLAHVSRVTTLGEMAASIAHEVDQPLSGIIINANACLRFLTTSSPNLDEVRDGLQAIARDGGRASEVIARIRALARRATTDKGPVDINDVIREVVALAEEEARRARARLLTELAADLPQVLGDRIQLQQVVLNLLLNGLDAMSAVVDRPRELVIRTHPEETDRVRVSVQDSGSGIEPQLADRVFEAFYTTKRDGIGMGLSISRSIIEQHGGRLWAEPNDGAGTTFQFTV